jgi:hypothetical protein
MEMPKIAIALYQCLLTVGCVTICEVPLLGL